MARQTLDSRYICSIYPEQLPEFTAFVGVNPDPMSPRCTKYSIGAVKRGEEPKVIEVFDGFENKQDWMASSAKRRAWMSTLVPCERLVANILNYWAGNMVGIPAGIGPGIGMIANKEPTTQELEALTMRQVAFFEFEFASAERLAIEKKVGEITAPMKLSAEWLGRKVNWAATAFSNMVPCKFCRQEIPPDASVCHVCGRDQENKPSAAPASTDDINEMRKQIKELLAAQAVVNAQVAGQPIPIQSNQGLPIAYPPKIEPKPLPQRPAEKQ